MLGQHGHVTVLAPAPVAREALRRGFADAGLGLGIDVETSASWVSSLWELLGNGCQIVLPLERQLIMTSVVAGHAAEELAPIRNNPGTIRMLSRMTDDLLPYAQNECALDNPSAAERVVLGLLHEYALELEKRSLVELSQAAEILRAGFSESGLPACAYTIVLRDVAELPAYLVRLLAEIARAGEVTWLLDSEKAPFADDIARAFDELGVEACRAEIAGVPLAGAPLASRAGTVEFLEVAGPHARDAAYADEIACLLDAAAYARDALVVAARPGELFDALAPRLAHKGIELEARVYTGFGQTLAGQQFTALTDVVERLEGARAGRLENASWWPAPELADWVCSPLSGAGSFEARRFDKKLRSTRSLTPEAVMRQLQSIQGRVNAARAKLDPDNPLAGVPCVCADVPAFLAQNRPVSALKAMLTVAEAQPASAFGTRDGRARRRAEVAILQRALEVVGEMARRLDVSQAVAVSVLAGLSVAVSKVAAPEAGEAEEAEGNERAVSSHPHARLLTAAEASWLAPASVDALICADLDVSSYPLSHEEGPHAALATRLGCQPLAIEPMALQRSTFARVLASARTAPVLARVTHDCQAADCYPAAIWTELAAAARGPHMQSVGEEAVAQNIDPASLEGAQAVRASCLPPQELSAEAAPYLVLTHRDSKQGAGSEAPLVPRQLSASQIESYLTCPLCWFMSNRVRPQQIDAGFGSMEMGNFVHDVLYRFQSELAGQGVPRVTSGNLEGVCIPLLREVFAEVRSEHARGKTASSGALVPLSQAQARQVDQLLPQLEAVLAAEARALAPFAPRYLEYSFNNLGITYAGRPLGGRIDRVDVDAENRAVVIDYKHRAQPDQFKATDPTVPNKRTGSVPADAPDWLPQHTQTLIYAQALRHSDLGINPRAALYFSTKDIRPALRGAASAELVEQEPGDGRIPGLKAGFPNEEAGGTMGFDELLDHVEAVVERRLNALEAGDVRASAEACPYCGRTHGLGFERREA